MLEAITNTHGTHYLNQSLAPVELVWIDQLCKCYPRLRAIYL